MRQAEKAQTSSLQRWFFLSITTNFPWFYPGTKQVTSSLSRRVTNHWKMPHSFPVHVLLTAIVQSFLLSVECSWCFHYSFSTQPAPTQFSYKGWCFQPLNYVTWFDSFVWYVWFFIQSHALFGLIPVSCMFSVPHYFNAILISELPPGITSPH